MRGCKYGSCSHRTCAPHGAFRQISFAGMPLSVADAKHMLVSVFRHQQVSAAVSVRILGQTGSNGPSSWHKERRLTNPRTIVRETANVPVLGEGSDPH